MPRSVRRLSTALARDTRGSIAVVMALIIVTLLLAAGALADYMRTVADRSTVQKAADAAALAASRSAAKYLDTNGGWTTANIAAAQTLGIATAQTTFTANVADLKFASTPTVDVAMTVTAGQPIVTVVNATASVPTTLMSIAGIRSVDLGASASAQTGSSIKYYQFVFLVDVSGSMTIGGSDSEITKLTGTYNTNFRDSTQCQSKKTSFTACAFACHDPNNVYPCSSYPDKKTRRVTAGNLSIKLKIDYVKSAISTFLSTVSSAITSSGADAIASIYTFGSQLNTLATGVSIASASTTAASIQIETINPSNNWGYTNTTSALNSLAGKLTNVGDGSSTSKRKTYVVFVTDGLEDTSGSCSIYGRCTGVGYTTGCTKVKAVDSSLVFVSIEATYPTVTGDTQYNTIVAPYTTAMANAMKTCATTSNWYFSADDGPGIETAMTAAVQQITSALRLSK